NLLCFPLVGFNVHSFGDTVELSSCLQNETTYSAYWKYGDMRIADSDLENFKTQFKDRLILTKPNFNLIVKKLTLQDSGNFSFVSSFETRQRPTVLVDLRVHEPITKRPVMTVNSTWHALNKTCTVSLECKGTATYDYVTWMVRNQTISGSRLKYNFQVSDEDTNFICTLHNFVSNLSTSKMLNCNNKTQKVNEHKDGEF
uniref:Ig-like domain-containing protein n=1 Tax=Mola mola TaxID=94237 RepID=A0A3Q3X888_MOLML